jgi:hypothetical protein
VVYISATRAAAKIMTTIWVERIVTPKVSALWYPERVT